MKQRLAETISDFSALFLADVPMIDTRAPVEFARGSFPNTVNLPLMNDDEREQVGRCYKRKGQQAAIELGHKLVSGSIRQQRIAAWLEFADAHPDGTLFCFRGGLRSQICQQWLQEAGCHYPRVAGGYKAMRRFLLEQFENASRRSMWVVIAGHTGSAKTKLLDGIPNSIDLEGLANHRGSAFGKRPGGQPSQIDFENSFAIAVLKQIQRFPERPIVLEDESHLIGRCSIPPELRSAMQRAPLILLESSLAERVENTYTNYILDALFERQALYGEAEGFRQFCDYLKGSLFNIRRRLGGSRYAELEKLLQAALNDHDDGDPESHRGWIEILLRDYYDPMYSYQIRQKQDRVIFSGPPAEVMAFIEESMSHEKLVRWSAAFSGGRTAFGTNPGVYGDSR